MEPIEVPSDSRPVYTMRLRVRTYEADGLGHVNNAVYLNYMEQAAVEHAESMGWGKRRLLEIGRMFVIRQHEVLYLGSAVDGDVLTISTWAEEMAGPRAWRAYIVQNSATKKRLVAARTLWVWVDAITGRPRPLPRDIIDTFTMSRQEPLQRPDETPVERKARSTEP